MRQLLPRTLKSNPVLASRLDAREVEAHLRGHLRGRRSKLIYEAIFEAGASARETAGRRVAQAAPWARRTCRA